MTQKIKKKALFLVGIMGLGLLSAVSGIAHLWNRSSDKELSFSQIQKLLITDKVKADVVGGGPGPDPFQEGPSGGGGPGPGP